MNLSQMKVFVKGILGDGAGYYQDSDIVEFLNEGALAVGMETLCGITYVTANTVPGQERYPLPQDFLSLKDVQITVGGRKRPLERLTYDKYHTVYEVAQSGEPRAFKMELGATAITPSAAPGDLWLQPVPTEAWLLTIAYFQRALRLVNTVDDENSYELQVFLHRPVCYHAALNLCLRYDDNSRAGKFKALYDDALFSAKGLIGRMDRSEPYKFEKHYGRGRSSVRRRR